MHTIIVGGGIAGLTAALALRQCGVEVTVIEQAGVLSDVGAGIQIAANGAHVMKQLGLEEQLAGMAVSPQSWEMRDLRTGRLLTESPLGDRGARHWGGRMYNVHRADLIEMLARALPGDKLLLGRKFVSFAQDEKGVSVTLDDGTVVRGDALVGADGIRSEVRRQLRGEEETQFANILMWRAMIPAEKLASLNIEEKGNYWFGPGRTIISYWVRPQQQYSLIASVPATEVQRESWLESGDVSELRRSFSDVEPRVAKLLEQIDTAFITGMYYRDPIDRWTYGRVTLIGDAAHPMVPFLAQGACQGIEDAWVLAAVLGRASSATLPAALCEYETRRRPRTTRVQSNARAMVKALHETDERKIDARNGRFKGLQHIDPYTETTWGFVWKYNVVEAAERPAGEVEGLTGIKEGKELLRPEAQRAFTMLRNAFLPEHVARGYDGLREGYDAFLKGQFPVHPEAKREATELNGVPAILVQPTGIVPDEAAPVVLHFHGGGYVIGSAEGSLEYASRLATAVGGDCFTVDYRLAPENAYPAALDDAVAAYRGLLRRGVPASRIILSGESSGGGLALAAALALKVAGAELPGGIIAVCPFTDLMLRGESILKFDGEDPAVNRDMLAGFGASYFRGHEPTDPLVSPLYGDLSGLPPLYLTAVNGEVLQSDLVRLEEKARAAGVQVTSKMVDD